MHCSEPFIVCELSLDEFRQVDHRVYSGYVQVEYYPANATVAQYYW